MMFSKIFFLRNARYIHLRQRIRKIKRTDQNSLGPKFDNLFSMMMANKKEHLRWNVRRYMIDYDIGPPSGFQFFCGNES